MAISKKSIMPWKQIDIALSGSAKDENRTVTVGIYDNAPKIFTSESGKPSGIFIELIEYIAKKEGWTLLYRSGTWSECLIRLENGEIDIIPDMAYTAEREKIFAFSNETVLSSWSQVYARKGSGIRSIIDLDGKKIAVLQDSVQQEIFENLSESFDIKITVIPVPDYNRAFEMAAKNEIDAAVSNNFYGIMHAKEFKLDDTAVIFSPAKLMFAASRNAPGYLLNAIDRHLIDLKNNPQSVYYQSIKRWTSEKVKLKLPLWMQILIFTVIIALLISLIWSLILKHQVNVSTRELRLINKEMESRIIERTAELEKINETLSSEIRDRMKIDKELKYSEAKYRDLVENANSIILRWTKGGKISFINQYAQRFFGFSEAEIIGKNIIGTIVPEKESSGRDISTLVNDIFTNPEIYALNENENITKKGEKKWISWSNRLITNDNNEVIEILSVGNDITDRKKSENLLKHTLNELTEAKEKAESADRLKSAFLATMSHELRTPLNSIIGFSGILLQELAGPLNSEQIKQLTMISSSSDHLLSLINDILDLSKIEAGQLKLKIENFNVRAAIEKAISAIKPLIEKKNLALEIHIDSRIDSAIGDIRRVEQILLNLLSNAVKFSEKGSIVIKSSLQDNKVQISIIDSGIGIKEENLDKLFKPFSQIEIGLTRQYEGTGLGLSICKKLVELMGGSIRVDSQWGKGSDFSFTIPA